MIGASTDGLAGVALIAAGTLLVVVGAAIGIGWRLCRLFTVHVPANRFGICSGMGTVDGSPGFTERLATQIDIVAGLQAPTGPLGPPLTFGQLWRATT
jgi:hypothetical protein